MNELREDNSAANSPKLPRWSMAASSTSIWELLLILAVFFIIGGAPAPHVNETQYLAKAKHYWDPSYCPSDDFLDSADAHLVFYWTFGWLTKFFSLTTTAWIGRVFAWTFLAVAWQRVTRRIVVARWAAPLAAALFVTLIDRGNLAGEWVVGGVEAKCFAYGFVLLGLAALASRHWRICWIWFGLAAAFHPLVGGWAVLGGLFVLLFERESRPPLHEVAVGLVIGGLLALPGLLPALWLSAGEPAEVTAEAARIYVFERLPHHLALLKLPQQELLWKLSRFGLTTLLMLIAWRMAWLLGGRVSPQGSKLAQGSYSALRRIMLFAVFSLLSNVVGLMIEASLGETLAAASWLRYYWFRQGDVYVPLAASLGVACLLPAAMRQPKTSLQRLAVGIVLLATLACGWHLTVVSAARWHNPRPPANRRTADLADWQAACEWIDDEMPADALFLIDKHAQSFKWYAKRGEVANWKDVPQDARGVVDWYSRCHELFWHLDSDGEMKPKTSLSQQGTLRCLEFANKYGATHLLTRSRPRLQLPVVFSNESYTVYQFNKNLTPEAAN